MTTAGDPTLRIDEQARRLHRASLAQVSPQTLMRLRSARHEAQRAAPARAGHWRWLAATAFTGMLAVGLGLRFLLPASTPVPAAGERPAVPALAGTTTEAPQDDAGASALFDEDPDLYLWLATAEAQPLAMESSP